MKNYTDLISSYQALQAVEINEAMRILIFNLLDLTRLNFEDTEEVIIEFFQKAQSVLGHVAAVCIFPRFVKLARAQFANSPVKIATVVNFPQGSASISAVLIEIDQVLQDGAQEIDLVFPYDRYLGGEREYCRDFIATCRTACDRNILLKVILEVGRLKYLDLIAEASKDMIDAGADFIKTSTGKITEGASLEALAVMLAVIKDKQVQLKRPLGVKVAGGVKTVEQAAQYIQLADHILGKDWVTPKHFRIGASQLVDELLT